MRWKLTFVVLLISFLHLDGQQSNPSAIYHTRQKIGEILGFELEGTGGIPIGWGGGPKGTIIPDNAVVHSGHWSVRLDRSAKPPESFSTVSGSIPLDFTGKRIELRGYLRTQNVSGFAGLWLREDGDGKMVQFDNMQSQNLAGTHEWAEYSISLPVNTEADQLFFGVLLSGDGVAWADDLQLLVDGKPISEAPQRPSEAVDPDHEFDKGSEIRLTQLTPLQIENLVTLGRVWGFLKYHHPQITSGKRFWDHDLFRIMPSIFRAGSRSEANAVLSRWIDSLGPIEPCTACTSLDTVGLKLKPDIDWIADRRVLGERLSRQLQAIYKSRIVNQQYYVSLSPYVLNPSFDHELAYGSFPLPDAGLQMLALFRFWNIIEYWSPNRNLIEEDWPKVLAEFIPRVALAKDKDSYALAMMTLIARVNDTHANLWSSIDLRPPTGACRLPVTVRFIENSAVVTGYTSVTTGKASGLELGDQITALDGVPTAKLVETWTPVYADSNDASRLRDIARNLTNGSCGPARVEVRRSNRPIELTPSRLPNSEAGPIESTHDLPGETFRLLSKDVAYLKLSSIKSADVSHYIDAAKGTKGLVIDIRDYPSNFVVFDLGNHLVHALRKLHQCRSVESRGVSPWGRRVAYSWRAALFREGHHPGRRDLPESGRVYGHGVSRRTGCCRRGQYHCGSGRQRLFDTHSWRIEHHDQRDRRLLPGWQANPARRHPPRYRGQANHFRHPLGKGRSAGSCDSPDIGLDGFTL